MRLLILVPLFALLAACGQQVEGTPLAISGEEPEQTQVSPAPSRPARPSSGTVRPSGTTPPRTTSPGGLGSRDLSAYAGTWEGTYTCAQGKTGLKLTIEPPRGDKAPATFEFFPVSGGGEAKPGSYRMTLGYSSGSQLKLTQEAWINQPEGYQMVDLVVLSQSQTELSGRVTDPSCETFTVTRK